MFIGDGLDEDAVGRGLNVSPCAFDDFKLLAELAGDDDLAFDREADCVRVSWRFHVFRLLL